MGGYRMGFPYGDPFPEIDEQAALKLNLVRLAARES
jgi:hypothetical protein